MNFASLACALLFVVDSTRGKQEPPFPAVDPAAPTRIAVVDRRTGAPEPAAEVIFLDLAAPRTSVDDPRDEFLADNRFRPLAKLLQFGTSLPLDRDAALVLPSFSARALVAARTGDGRFAFESIDRAATRVTLALEPDRSAEVSVVDAAGAPAPGIAVQLFGSGQRDCIPLWTARSDEHGCAKIDHLQVLLDSEGYRLRLGVPSREPIEIESSDRRARLALPPYGTVVVDVDQAGGSPAEAWLSVCSGSAGDDPWNKPSVARFYAPVIAGKARFEHVGLGLDLCAGACGIAGSTPVEGPRAAGEQKTAKL